MSITPAGRLMPWLLAIVMIGGIALLATPNDILNSNRTLTLVICIPLAIVATLAIVFMAIVFVDKPQMNSNAKGEQMNIKLTVGSLPYILGITMMVVGIILIVVQR